jgi:hypothetical protein
MRGVLETEFEMSYSCLLCPASGWDFGTAEVQYAAEQSCVGNFAYSSITRVKSEPIDSVERP